MKWPERASCSSETAVCWACSGGERRLALRVARENARTAGILLRTTDSRGVETDTAIVLEDAAGRQIDVHAVSLRPDGSAVPAYDGGRSLGERLGRMPGVLAFSWLRGGRSFSAEDLSGEGTIAGVRVRCLSVEMQFRGHTGYELPERQIGDLELLRERFGAGRAA
jgi:hypothetical protein